MMIQPSVYAYYQPFGECRFSSGTSPTDSLFTGQKRDIATAGSELYYYGARYYDPQIGRFISADTKVPDPTNPQAFNRYAYVINNPLKYTDPTGHGWWSIVTDIASIAFDVYQMASEPSWGNAGWLALDVALTCLPGIPAGAGPLAKGLTKVTKFVEDGEKVVKGADKAVEGAKTTEKVVETAKDDVNIASKDRTKHILHGDKTGGGHMWPGAPGKTPFPKTWDEKTIMNNVSDIATDPNLEWKPNIVVNGVQRYEVTGVRDGVTIKVITDGKDIITAFPIY
jgi:RHS repeat-associated protein